MQTYEVFYTGLAGCDSEWEYVGKVQAESLTDAVEQAAKLWSEYPRECLAVCDSVVARPCSVTMSGENASKTPRPSM